MSNVIRLPTAATSYLTVRKAGRVWPVEIVTPSPGQPLRTVIARYSDRAEAIHHGLQSAERTKRPFKGKHR